MTSREEPRDHSYYDTVAVPLPEVPMPMCNGGLYTEVPGQKTSALPCDLLISTESLPPTADSVASAPL